MYRFDFSHRGVVGTVLSTMALASALAFADAQQPDPSLGGVYAGMNPKVAPSDYVIHDPSRIVTVGDRQLIAVTGKAQEDGYDCGLETWWRELGKARWRPGQCLLRTKPAWAAEEVPGNDGAFWAPELDLGPDGSLALLYSVADHGGDGAPTCVGVARAEGGADKFPNRFAWADLGRPVTCVIDEDYDEERSAIDPSAFAGMGDDGGRLFLATGGGAIVGTELDPATRDQIDGEWYDEGGDDWRLLARGPVDEEAEGGHAWVEAAYVHPNPDAGYYYLFVNWGACCRGTDSTYEIRVGRSSSPLGPYVDEAGADLADGGGTLVLESGTPPRDGFVIGPGHAGVWTDARGRDWLSHHYYDGRRDEGLAWIAERRLKWRKNGWPYVTGKPKRAFPKTLL